MHAPPGWKTFLLISVSGNYMIVHVASFLFLLGLVDIGGLLCKLAPPGSGSGNYRRNFATAGIAGPGNRHGYENEAKNNRMIIDHEKNIAI